MLLKVLLILCIIIALYGPLMVSGRGGRSGGRSRTTSHRSSHKSGGGGGVGWFSWFRGGSSSSSSASSSSSGASSAKKTVPPALSHRNNVAQSPSHIGFAAYGNNYQANFHNSPSHQFQPTSHPYQSHFQPQTTGEP